MQSSRSIYDGSLILKPYARTTLKEVNLVLVYKLPAEQNGITLETHRLHRMRQALNVAKSRTSFDLHVQ